MKKLLFICIFFPICVFGQTNVETSKVLNYKQPVYPIGADNYQFSTFYYNHKKAYNMKGYQIGSAPYDIISIKMNPAGSNYALLSRKKDKGLVEIMDVWSQKKVIRSLEEVSLPEAICYSADSRRFFVADAFSKLYVYETRQYSQMAQWKLPAVAEILETSSNGYFVAAVSGNQLFVYNQETGNLRTTLFAEGKIGDIAFSNSSDLLGILTREGKLLIYDTRTFQVTNTITLSSQTCMSVAFHPEEKYVVVLTSPEEMVFINMLDPTDRTVLKDTDKGLTYLKFLKDGKQNIYLTHNTDISVKYKQLKGLSRNLTKLMTDELNARMEEWAKMQPGETLEEYQARVNEESRLQQARLFEQEIATELADGLVMQSDVSLGGYNHETSMLTLNFDNMPQIYLTVPEEEVSSFQNASDLEFRDVVYGMTKNEKFEIIYANVFNKATGKSYEFNNLERQSLDFLQSQDDFVPIELVQQSSMEDVKLQAIKDDVVSSAKQNNLISDHTNIKVSSNVVSDVDAEGRKITNYKVNFNYTVEGNYSIQEDFAAGKYKIEQSHAAVSMLEIVTRAFAQDFAQYIKPGKKVIIKLTGSADALKINGSIVYDGCYGNFVEEPYYLDGLLNTITVTDKTGIRKNEQLAFMRAIGVKDYMVQHIPSLQTMQTDYQYHIELAEGTGGEFRRINVEFVFVDAFDNE